MLWEPSRVALLILVTGLSAGCSTIQSFLFPARATDHEVDFEEALLFAERADAAYLDPAVIEDRYRGQRVVVEDLPASEVRFFVLFDDGARVQHIAVRGTSNLANIRTDVEFTPQPDPEVNVHLHQGFASAARELHERILPLLKRDYGTTLAGHSLGGALAAILGMYLQADGFRIEAIRTFGQPKVTNLEGAEAYRELPIIRFVNGDDPVADVPPLLTLSESSWAYTHFGPEVILRGEKNYAYLEEHQAMGTAVVSFWSSLGSHDVHEHEMAAYLAGLRARREAAREVPAFAAED